MFEDFQSQPADQRVISYRTWSVSINVSLSISVLAPRRAVPRIEEPMRKVQNVNIWVPRSPCQRYLQPGMIAEL